MTRNEQILQWIETARAAIETSSLKEFPDCEPNHMTLTMMRGKKYIRLVVSNLKNEHRSAYAFLDTEGNIYKAAGWKAPAKGIRGTIDSVDPSKLTSSTYWLYR